MENPWNPDGGPDERDCFVSFESGRAAGSFAERARIVARLRYVAKTVAAGDAFFACPEVALQVMASEIEREP